jgi:hypothetical protein
VFQALLRNNFSVALADLTTTGEIPEDCAVLVIAGPTVALGEDEARAIDRYLDRGGDALMLLDPGPGVVGHGLDGVLEEYGIVARTGHMCHVVRVAQAIVTREAEALTFIPVPFNGYTIQPIVEPLRNRYRTALLGACVVEAEVAEGVEAQELFYMPRTTMPGQDVPNFAARMSPGWQSRVRSGSVSEEAGDIIGRSSLAVAAERPVGDGEDGARTRVVVIGDSDFALTRFVGPRSRQPVPANLTLFVNAVSWLAEREAYIAIEPKTLEFARERADLTRLDQTQQEIYKTALLVVPVVLIPLLVVYLGFVVWWRRRR